jgi:hypothetical protein
VGATGPAVAHTNPNTPNPPPPPPPPPPPDHHHFSCAQTLANQKHTTRTHHASCGARAWHVVAGQFPPQLSPLFARPGVAALPGGAPTSRATLTPGVWNRVTVCHTEQGYFWVHEEQRSERLSETEMAMAEVYGAADGVPAEVTDDMVTVGAWFAAPYAHPDAEATDEAMWTRAMVDAKLDDGTIVITHVDYGSTATLVPSELRLLTPEFLALPAQAIKCEMNGTQGYTGPEQRAALAEILTELLDWQSFYCALVTPAVGNGPCAVNLYTDAAVDVLISVEERINAYTSGDGAGGDDDEDDGSVYEPSKTGLTPQGSDTADAAATAAARSKPQQQQPPQQQKHEEKPPAQKHQGPAWSGAKNPSVLEPPSAKPPAKQNSDGWVEVAKKPAQPSKTAGAKAGQGAPRSQKNGPHGFVFHCSSSTVDECLSRQLFGLPRKFFEMMQTNIKPAIDGEATPTVLFLFNIQKGQLYGPFVATSETGQDLEPDAWKEAMRKTSQRGSPFPAQVRGVVW